MTLQKVPADIAFFKSGDPAKLFLPPVEYRLSIRDAEGKLLSSLARDVR